MALRWPMGRSCLPINPIIHNSASHVRGGGNNKKKTDPSGLGGMWLSLLGLEGRCWRQNAIQRADSVFEGVGFGLGLA